MKKIFSGILITILLSSMCILSFSASAAETTANGRRNMHADFLNKVTFSSASEISLMSVHQKAKISIPVSVTISQNSPEEKEVYKIAVKSDNPAFPLPSGSDDSVYLLEIEGEGSEQLDIEYTNVGIYTYQITQQVGENKNCVYDDTVYEMKVAVTYDDTGELLTSVVLHYDRGSQKPDNIIFDNEYKARPNIVVPDYNSKEDTDTDSEKDTSSKTASSTQPEKTTSSTQPEKNASTVKSPVTGESTVQTNPLKTGDERHVMLIFLIMAVGLAVAAANTKALNKNKEQSL